MQLSRLKNLTLFFLLIYLTNISPSLGNSTVAIIDINYILKNSNSGKELFIKLEKINKNNIKILEKEENKLKEKEIKLKQLQNVASEEEINKKLELLNKDIKKYKQLKQSLVKNYNETKKKNFDQFIIDIRPTLELYMKENSLTLLIDKRNIFIAHSETDITNDILKILNKK